MKNLFLNLIFLSVFFLGCSNANNQPDIISNEDSVKSVIINFENSSIWTYEIEGERLSKPYLFNDLFSHNGIINVESINSISNICDPLLPEIKDFASLDISSLDGVYYKFICDVCNSMINTKNLNISSFFDKNYIFNFVFFINDLKENWRTHFKINFPKDKIIFSSYVIGKHLESFDIIQIPVRFYCSSGYVDLLFNMNQNTKELKIQKIDFLNWEIEYGK